MFDIQNNDFGWKHLPCSDMHHNTVYLLLTALLKNFYNHIVQKVAKVFHDISPTTRLKRFIFRFICVCGKLKAEKRRHASMLAFFLIFKSPLRPRSASFQGSAMNLQGLFFHAPA